MIKVSSTLPTGKSNEWFGGSARAESRSISGHLTERPRFQRVGRVARPRGSFAGSIHVGEFIEVHQRAAKRPQSVNLNESDAAGPFVRGGRALAGERECAVDLVRGAVAGLALDAIGEGPDGLDRESDR